MSFSIRSKVTQIISNRKMSFVVIIFLGFSKAIHIIHIFLMIKALRSHFICRLTLIVVLILAQIKLSLFVFLIIIYFIISIITFTIQFSFLLLFFSLLETENNVWFFVVNFIFFNILMWFCCNLIVVLIVDW